MSSANSGGTYSTGQFFDYTNCIWLHLYTPYYTTGTKFMPDTDKTHAFAGISIQLHVQKQCVMCSNWKYLNSPLKEFHYHKKITNNIVHVFQYYTDAHLHHFRSRDMEISRDYRVRQRKTDRTWRSPAYHSSYLSSLYWLPLYWSYPRFLMSAAHPSSPSVHCDKKDSCSFMSHWIVWVTNAWSKHV